jgi:hypothetical protein
VDSTHTTLLDIPELSKAASVAHIFPAMKNNSLLSVGQLCDECYSILFSISKITILNSKHKTLLKGSRYLNKGLLILNLRQKEVQTRGDTDRTHTQVSEANTIYDLHNAGALVNYLHRVMFICTKSALIHAVKKGHLAT